MCTHLNDSVPRPGPRHLVAAIGAFACITVCAAAAFGQPSFVNYQGELRKEGVPYDGIAFAKFVVVANVGAETLWSNDGTSVLGSEPQHSVNLDVVDGVFSTQLGAEGMVPLTAASLDASGNPALRVWIDTGDGFERLSDQPIASAAFALVCETVNQIGSNTTSFIPRWTGTALESGTVFDNGKVGIGTTAPVAKLDVAGTIAVNGHVVVNATGQWIGEPGIGPPGPQGPDGPAPAHQWSGTSLRFQNPDTTWGTYVNLQGPVGPQGPPGPPVSTYCTATSQNSCNCNHATLLSQVRGFPTCYVSSNAGPCTATGSSEAWCCVCRP